MNIFQSIILGIVQGLTEFLPVSSSGHLTIVPYLFGWEIPETETFVFDVLVQVFTLAGVFAYFWKDLFAILLAFFNGIRRRQAFTDPNARLGWYLILATIPAGLIGLVIKDLVAELFSQPIVTGFFLLVTAAMLFLAERLSKSGRVINDLSWKDALWIGVFQALAIFPGISRSGATITAGMLAKLDRTAAARFSFLMSIPVMLAAGLLASLDLMNLPQVWDLLPVFLPGFLAAAITGYLAIRWLLAFLTHRPLYVFAGYCLVIGFVLIGSYIF